MMEYDNFIVQTKAELE